MLKPLKRTLFSKYYQMKHLKEKNLFKLLQNVFSQKYKVSNLWNNYYKHNTNIFIPWFLILHKLSFDTKRIFVSSSQQSAEAWPENWSDTGHDGGGFYHLQSPQSDPQCVRGMLTVTWQHIFQKIMLKIHI